MSTLTLVAGVLVVAVIAYGVYTSIQAGLARTSELKALAPQLGLTFVGDFAPTSTANATGNPRDDFEALRAAFGDFRRFQGSMRPRLWNWMRGERDGTSVSLFDYDEGHSQRDIGSIRTLAWIEDPSLTLPPFSLVPIPSRHVLPKIRVAQALGGLVGHSRHNDREIAMPTHPEFENQYLLRGQDETALRRVFTDRVLRFFCENQGWMVEGDGKRLLLNRLSAEEVRTYWRGAVKPNDAAEIRLRGIGVAGWHARGEIEGIAWSPASGAPVLPERRVGRGGAISDELTERIHDRARPIRSRLPTGGARAVATTGATARA